MILHLKYFTMMKISEDIQKIVVTKMLNERTQVTVTKDLNVC